MKNILKNIIDLHIHSAPDIRKRSHNDNDLLKVANKKEIRAIVLKSHLFPTTDRAWHMQYNQSDVQVFGSLTLNPSVGGINPYAVENALQLGAKIIWLPTLYSMNHRTSQQKNDGIRVIYNNKIIKPLIEIFELIASYDVVLATGHLSSKEIFTVVKEAKKRGVKKIVITHPEFKIINLTIKEQIQLRKEFGVFFERTYAQPIGNGIYQSNLETNLHAIKAVGYKSTIISSDSGQIENPSWEKSMQHYLNFLYNSGVSLQELNQMTKINPSEMLNLPYQI